MSSVQYSFIFKMSLTEKLSIKAKNKDPITSSCYKNVTDHAVYHPHYPQT